MAKNTNRPELKSGAGDFLKHVNSLLNSAQQQFEFLAETNPALSDFYSAACLPIAGVKEQITLLDKASRENDEVAAQFSKILVETGGPQLMASVVSAGGGDGGIVGNVKAGLDLGKDIIGKASKWLPPPFDKVARNVGDVLGVVGKLAGDKSAELKKLDELEETIGEIQEELIKVEGKAERLGTLTGHPVVTGPDSTLVDPPTADGYGQSTIPGSLLWMVWQNQFKLEHLWRKTFGDDIPLKDGWIEKPPPVSGLRDADAWLRENGGQIGRLAHKIDQLAEWLGKSIVARDVKWDPEPPIHIGTRERPREEEILPEKAVKEELHDIEDILNGMRRLIEKLFDLDLIDIDVDIFNIVNNLYSSILETRPFKRIYTYDEGVFQADTPRHRQRIRIRTPSFDLAGWVDLEDLRVGDEVRIDVFVFLPSSRRSGRRRRLYSRQHYRGTGSRPGRARRSPDGRGVKSLQDICGPTILVGKAIDIEIRQTASASGYPSPVEIGYQFVVESADDGSS